LKYTRSGYKHRDAFDIAELAKKEQEQKHLELEASVKRLNEKVGELNKQITGLKRDKRRVELERDQLKKKGNDLSFTLGQAATIRKLETKGKGG
jgi:chromosome segregation ATPase